MTVGRSILETGQRVSDLVRGLALRRRGPRMTPEEAELANHLRGNTALFESLTRLLQTRIAGRANVPEPSDPLEAKSMLARDREIQWVLKELEALYHAPVNPAGESGEPPE